MYKVDVGGGGVCIKWMLGVEGCGCVSNVILILFIFW